MAGYHLPEDVLVQVLSRLPVKSLLRFKCVSKSWRDILKDPSFITKHYLTRATSNNGSTVLTRRFHERKIYEFALMSDDTQAIKFSYLNLPFFKKEHEEWEKVGRNFDLNFAGPINGIVIVSDFEDVSYLWNPATREYKALPWSSTPSLVSENLTHGNSVIGFGIDPVTNGYKVVRIWEFLDWEAEESYIVELLCLSAYSCKPCRNTWKIIDASPSMLPIGHEPSVYLKGKYYWGSGDNAGGDGSIYMVWFDMGKELFGLIELSDVHSDPDDFYLCFRKLVILKDSLGIIRYTERVDENCFYKIWLMNECEAQTGHNFNVWWSYSIETASFEFETSRNPSPKVKPKYLGLRQVWKRRHVSGNLMTLV